MDQNFKNLAKNTLEDIFDNIEKKYDHFDVDFEEENLKIESGNNIFILSIHNPSSQIWLSSPVSGAYHFKFNNSNHEWISTRHKSIKLLEVLEKDLESINI